MQVRIAKDKQDIERCLKLRKDVFVNEQNVPEDLELDGRDSDCTHIIAIENDHTVGAARLMKIEDSYKIQRVCVAASKRGHGVGAAMMDLIIEHSIASEHINVLKLSSQKDAIPFYEKLGFTCYGGEYLDAGIPHRDMKRTLS